MDLSVIIPFYNEEENIEYVFYDLMNTLKNKNLKFELILVNNGSADNTENICNKLVKKHKNARLINIKKNIGYGFGVLSGLNSANGEYICYTDGDGQTKAENVYRLYKKATDDNFFIVKSVRTNRESVSRKLMSVLYNAIIFLLFQAHINDINAKPKLFKRSLFKKLNIKSIDWFIDTEITLKARMRGHKIAEVPINYATRRKGESDVKSATVFEFIRNIVLFRLGVN